MLEPTSDTNLLSDELELTQLRAAYVQEVQALSSLVEKLRLVGKTDEEIAIEIHHLRREIGIKYKNLTPPQERQIIYSRNLRKYGDELGPSVDYLHNVQNKTWEEIIESSMRTSVEINQKLGLKSG